MTLDLRGHFSEFRAAQPARIHLAAHSHHFWPDAACDAHRRALNDAARLADSKWEMIFGELLPRVQRGIAAVLALPDPATLAFAPNTHDFVRRLLSALPPASTPRILTSDSEFHSFARQIARLEEDALVVVERIAAEPFASFPDRFAAAARRGGHDLVQMDRSHQAFMQDGAALCGPSPRDMRDGKYVYQIYNTSGFAAGGFLAGDVNEFRPSFVHHFNDGLTHGVSSGELGVVDIDETDTLSLYEWTDSPKVLRNPQDLGLQYSFPLFSANAVFWSASAGSFNRVVVYTDDGGVVDLLSSGADPSYGYDDFGSDGTDMVWMLGEGHDGGPIGFDSAAVFTAPFALNSTDVSSRRLRSESVKRFGVSPIRVGCGYGARSNGDYLRVIRLSDGVSWILPSTVGWSWLHPLAVTCEEVFTAISTGPNINNIARVRISSLGPGIAAD